LAGRLLHLIIPRAKAMRAIILNFDNSVTRQDKLLEMFRPEVVELTDIAPLIRIGCRSSCYERLLSRLDDVYRFKDDPPLTFTGSGDFHHVSLAILRRMPEPFNLVVFDSHPDWIRHVPIVHCGAWLDRAAKLPNLRRMYHFGVHHDISGPWLLFTPLRLMRGGKLRVFPAREGESLALRRRAPCKAIHRHEGDTAIEIFLANTLSRHLDEMCRHPVYISIDKDVFYNGEAITNWQGGLLRVGEVHKILKAIFHHPHFRPAGMDIGGDYSETELSGLLRKILYLYEKDVRRTASVEEARRNNEEVNIKLGKLFMR